MASSSSSIGATGVFGTVIGAAITSGDSTEAAASVNAFDNSPALCWRSAGRFARAFEISAETATGRSGRASRMAGGVSCTCFIMMTVGDSPENGT